VAALRGKVTVQPDVAVDPAQCDLVVRLKDGRSVSRHIQNVIGSLNNPLSDTALEAKFFDLTDGILSRPQATRLAETCWTIEKLDDAGVLARQAAA
ncbi:MAG TPA: hypothetical protein VNX61_11940, partial [Rhizomicrobium sp.]|nr:hypothetical protein [Rhizomicrobium sp.]